MSGSSLLKPKVSPSLRRVALQGPGLLVLLRGAVWPTVCNDARQDVRETIYPFTLAFQWVTFFVVAWTAQPHIHDLLQRLTDLPLGNRQFGHLAAALIGATFNPWMVFCQQAAVADKKLTQRNYAAAQVETAVGAVLTQLLTAAVLVAAAATLSGHGQTGALHSAGEISTALATAVGPNTGRILFSAGVLGASLIAAIVCSLSPAWGLGDSRRNAAS
jgi:Mn2+/Fe2+ NRAMP family transporter